MDSKTEQEPALVPLRERIESNICMNEKTVWEDEKDFTLEVPADL